MPKKSKREPSKTATKSKGGDLKVVASNKPTVRMHPRPVGSSIPSTVPQPAQRNSLAYPLCDAAVGRMAKGGWELADAILAECCEPGENGVRNGSQAKIEEMRHEIANNHGIDLSPRRVRKLRQVAAAYPPGRRRPGVSLEAHLEAGTPDALDKIINDAPAGTAFTVANVRALMHPTEQGGQNTHKQEQGRQEKDHAQALQDICRKLEKENEHLHKENDQLLQRYTEACRSGGRSGSLSPSVAEQEATQQPLPSIASPTVGHAIGGEDAAVPPTEAGVATGDSLDVPLFLTRRALTEEENKQFGAMEAAWCPFALALAQASPLARHRFETKYKVTLPKMTVEQTATSVVTVATLQP